VTRREQGEIAAGLPETPDVDGTSPRLDEGQMARLLELGRSRSVTHGDVLFAAGDAGADFFVVESGSVAIVQGHGAENRVIAVFGHRQFLGEISLLTGQRLYLSGVVSGAGTVSQIPVEKLREIVAEDKTLSDIILGAFIARRSFLIDAETGIRLIGSRYSPDSRRLREFLARNRMPHQWIDLEEDDAAEALLGQLAIEPDQTPVVIASGGEILRNPTNSLNRPGLQRRTPRVVRRRGCRRGAGWDRGIALRRFGGAGRSGR
jgi:thioredoxin reductase (NADPH)